MQIKGGTFQSHVTVGAKTGLDFSVGLYVNGLFALCLHFPESGGAAVNGSRARRCTGLEPWAW